jgi:hypothetical protein
MTTPDEEIKAFLSGSDGDDSRRLDVATLFAQSMVHELRSAAAQWEATAATLEEAHALRQRRHAGDSCDSYDSWVVPRHARVRADAGD